MPRPVRHKQRQALYGWLKWTPLFIAVFSALFFDAYLNLATRENDYVLNQLTKEKKELKTSLNDVRSRAAGKPDVGNGVRRDRFRPTRFRRDGGRRRRAGIRADRDLPL